MDFSNPNPNSYDINNMKLDLNVSTINVFSIKIEFNANDQVVNANANDL